MSRKLKAEDIKVGMLVRVAGRAFSNTGSRDYTRHHIKAGAVCSVFAVHGDDVTISGPQRHDSRRGEKPNGYTTTKLVQGVGLNQITRAKQATKKVSK